MIFFLVDKHKSFFQADFVAFGEAYEAYPKFPK